MLQYQLLFLTLPLKFENGAYEFKCSIWGKKKVLEKILHLVYLKLLLTSLGLEYGNHVLI